jgi:hypothetical protein
MLQTNRTDRHAPAPLDFLLIALDGTCNPVLRYLLDLDLSTVAEWTVHSVIIMLSHAGEGSLRDYRDVTQWLTSGSRIEQLALSRTHMPDP